MPTNNAKARILLKQEKAKVITIKPFTIQLLYETNKYTQPITLGIDSGYLHIGFSAICKGRELISGEIELLKNIKKRNEERTMYRRNKRNRLRYRKPRWNNRTKSKPKGWLAPSLQHKLDSHIRFIDKLNKILPITKTTIEIANFDIQKIKNPDIQGEKYQQGEQMGFWNLREYILHRDNHKCQNPNCKNKDESPILEIHHIIFKSNGGTDTPNNLITLCTKCHTTPNHKKGKFLYEWQSNKPKIRGFKDATFMNVVRWKLVNQLKEKYNNVEHTYGYITKNHRINNKIKKSHCNDAFCITKGINQVRIKPFLVKQIKRNNRSLETFKDAKYIDIRTSDTVAASNLNCGRRTRNKNKNDENLKVYRGRKVRKGIRSIRKTRYFYQPNDLVLFENKIWLVKGTQSLGKQVWIDRNGVKKTPNPKKLKILKFGKGFMFN